MRGVYGAEEVCSMAPGCTWAEAAAKCHDEDVRLDCFYFGSTEAACLSVEGCYFNVQEERCLNNGQKIPCFDHISVLTCEPNGCEWHPRVSKCREPGEVLTCADSYVKELCEARDECWYQETTATTIGQCYDLGFDKPCESYSTDDDCTAVAAARCSWHATGKYVNSKPASVAWQIDGEGSAGETAIVNFARAGGSTAHLKGVCHPSDMAPCSYITDAIACTPPATDGACMWDMRLARCRTLVAKRGTAKGVALGAGKDNVGGGAGAKDEL